MPKLNLSSTPIAMSAVVIICGSGSPALLRRPSSIRSGIAIPLTYKNCRKLLFSLALVHYEPKTLSASEHGARIRLGLE